MEENKLQKIFVADIGNSYSKIAIIDNKLNVIEKMYFRTQKKIDEKVLQKKFLKLKKNHKLNGSIIGSVISGHANIFFKVAKRAFGIDSYLMNENTKLSFTLKKIERNIVGQDILALAEFCSSKNKNSIGFSFGTAIFAILLQNNNLEGAAISAGLGLSFLNLSSRIEAIKDKKLDLKKKYFFGNDTISALESGINNLRTGYVSSFYENAIKLIPNKKIYCVICGGEAATVSINHEYEINVNAVLIGYALIFFKNNRIRRP